jgi:hypothetical protein
MIQILVLMICIILLFFLLYKLLSEFNHMRNLIKKIVLLNIWLDLNSY